MDRAGSVAALLDDLPRVTPGRTPPVAHLAAIAIIFAALLVRSAELVTRAAGGVATVLAGLRHVAHAVGAAQERMLIGAADGLSRLAGRLASGPLRIASVLAVVQLEGVARGSAGDEAVALAADRAAGPAERVAPRGFACAPVLAGPVPSRP